MAAEPLPPPGIHIDEDINELADALCERSPLHKDRLRVVAAYLSSFGTHDQEMSELMSDELLSIGAELQDPETTDDITHFIGDRVLDLAGIICPKDERLGH